VEEKLFSLGTSGHCTSVVLLLFSLFVSSTNGLGSRTLLDFVAGSILEHLSFLCLVEESGHCFSVLVIPMAFSSIE